MGGIFTSICDFKKALDSSVVDISKVDSQADISFKPAISIGYNLVLRYGKGQRKSLHTLLKSAQTVIIHGLYDEPSLTVYKMRLFDENFTYAIVPHGMLDPWVFTYRSLRKKIWFLLVGKYLLRHAAVVICASEGEKRKLMRITKDANYQVCHWGISDRYQEGRKAICREALERKWGIPQRPKLIILIGRISALKRFSHIAKTFLAGKLMEDYRMVIIGIPEEEAELKAIQDEIAKSKNSIFLLPPQFGQDKNDIYMAADLFVNMSHRENFSYTTVEALSFDLPVVVSDGVDIGDVLSRYPCTRILPVDAPAKEFEGAIRSLSENRFSPRNVYLENFTDKIFEENLKNLVKNATGH
jgi:poly(glycerol-phosphate) alpha-glucosyltransferase